MQDSPVEDWQDDEDSYVLPDPSYSQPQLSPGDGGWLSIPPWYGGFPEYSGQPTLGYEFSFIAPDPSSSGTLYPDSLPSPLQGESLIPQARHDQTPTASLPRAIHPRPHSFPASTQHLPLQRNPPARLSERSLPIQPKPSSNGKKKGRQRPLPEETRINAAKTRAEGSCLYHLTRKIRCYMGPTPDSSGACGYCANTGRPCHRLSPKYKEALVQDSQLSNSSTILPLLAQAGSATLEKQLRFRIDVGLSSGVAHFLVDQVPLLPRTAGECGSSQHVLGKIGHGPVLEIAQSIAKEAPVAAGLVSWASYRCNQCADTCMAETLLEEVRKCLSLHLLLRCLANADFRAPSTDQHAAKCFVISLANVTINYFRTTLKLTMESLFKVIQTHKKVHADPAYGMVRVSLTALCAVVDAIARSQIDAKITENTLLDAISGVLPQAKTFGKELHMLSESFCAIIDPIPQPGEFKSEVDRALQTRQSTKLTIVLDGSGSESSLRLEGAQPPQEARNLPPWSSARTMQSRTHSFPRQSVLRMFECTRPSEKDRKAPLGSPHHSPSVSDSEISGFLHIVADSRPISPGEGPSSGGFPRVNRTHKRARSDSMRTEHKKNKSPK